MKKLINKLKGQASPQAPRSMQELEKEFQSLSAQAANAQYKVYIHGEELKELNKRLVQVNQEAAERSKLDAAVKTELAKQAALKPKEEAPLDLIKSGAV